VHTPTPRPAGARGAAYVRVSDTVQETTRQHDSIRLWAGRHGVAVAETFEDKGGRRHEADTREGFQRLLAAVRAGKLDWVVIDAQDRLGFQDVYEYMHYVHVFRTHRCELWEAVGDRLLTTEEIATVITAGIGAHGSKEEMVKKSQRDLGKKRAMVERGEWPGGWIPYGCDVACRDRAGRERWRVVSVGKWRRLKRYPDGREELFEGRDNFPRKEAGETLVLVPTLRAERLDILRSIFAWLVDESMALNAIARRLNERGLHHPHGPWYATLVRGVLLNPAAVGTPAYNKYASGLYSEFGPDGQIKADPPRHPADPRKARNARRRPREQWILPARPLYDPLVDPAVFDRAAALLAGRPAARRAPRSEGLWLSGLVYCGRCGRPMVGWNTPADRSCPRSYACGSYRRLGKANPHGCRHHRVKADLLEALVDRYLEETGRVIEAVEAGGPDDLVRAIHDRSSVLYGRLADVRAGMEEFLFHALADEYDYQELPGGRRRYVLDYPREDLVLDLPGCDHPADLEAVYAWLGERARAAAGRRRAELEAELLALYRKWDTLPTERTRALCADEIRAAEAELERLAGCDLLDEARALQRQLWGQRQKVAQARQDLKGRAARRKAASLRAVVERLVCHFEYSTHGSQERSHLVRVEVLPVLDAPPREFSGPADLRNLGRPAPG
jgi:DNA invertase Pin-like site-specific DNA recombinase